MSLPVSSTRYKLQGGVPTEAQMKYSPLPILRPETTGAWKSWDGILVWWPKKLLLVDVNPFTIQWIWPWMVKRERSCKSIRI